MQDIEKEVLEAASTGDMRAFEKVYTVSSGFVYAVALRTLGNAQDAEEVTQEVFLIIYRSLKSFQFRSSFKTWVYRITARCAFSRIRKMCSTRRIIKEYAANSVVAGQYSRDDSTVDGNDRQNSLMRLLDVLCPEQKACIVLRAIEGLSYQQIADALKTNINTVRSRLKRAREILLAHKQEVVV